MRKIFWPWPHYATQLPPPPRHATPCRRTLGAHPKIVLPFAQYQRSTIAACGLDYVQFGWMDSRRARQKTYHDEMRLHGSLHWDGKVAPGVRWMAELFTKVFKHQQSIKGALDLIFLTHEESLSCLGFYCEGCNEARAKVSWTRAPNAGAIIDMLRLRVAHKKLCDHGPIEHKKQ